MVDGPPIQLSIDALNTTTPNLADLYIENNAYIPMPEYPQSLKHRSFEYHYTKLGTFNGRTMHIYLWHKDPQSIKHRCLEYH